MQARAIRWMNPDSLRVPKPGIGASAGPPAFGRSRKKLIDWHEILKCAADSDSRAQTLRSLSRKPSPQRAPVSREHSVSLAGQKPPSVPLAREATFGSSTSSRLPGSGHSLDEPISVFVVYRVSASARIFRGKAAARAGMQRFPDGVTQGEILDRLAKSPTIFHERIDHFNGGSLRSWHGVGLY